MIYFYQTSWLNFLSGFIFSPYFPIVSAPSSLLSWTIYFLPVTNSIPFLLLIDLSAWFVAFKVHMYFKRFNLHSHIFICQSFDVGPRPLLRIWVYCLGFSTPPSTIDHINSVSPVTFSFDFFKVEQDLQNWYSVLSMQNSAGFYNLPNSPSTFSSCLSHPHLIHNSFLKLICLCY